MGRLSLLSVLLFSLAPAAAGAQVQYSSEPGPFLVGAPLAYPYLGSDRSAWWAGAGWRLAGGTDVAVRVGRGEDTPYGNPLPVTSVGHTVVEARTGRLVRGTSREDGMILVLSALATVEDRSAPVSRADAEWLRFREGARLSEYGGRIELHRIWRLGGPDGFALHPRIGVLGQYARIRGNTVLHEPDGGTTANEGEGDFEAGIGVGLGFSIPLGELGRLVVEPRAEGPLRSYYRPAFEPGLALGLNF